MGTVMVGVVLWPPDKWLRLRVEETVCDWVAFIGPFRFYADRPSRRPSDGGHVCAFSLDMDGTCMVCGGPEKPLDPASE